MKAIKPTKIYFLHDDNNYSGNTDMFRHQKVFEACDLCLYLHNNLVSLTFNAVVNVGIKHGLNTGYTIVSSAATFKSSERLGRINSPFESHEKEKTR